MQTNPVIVLLLWNRQLHVGLLVDIVKVALRSHFQYRSLQTSPVLCDDNDDGGVGDAGVTQRSQSSRESKCNGRRANYSVRERTGGDRPAWRGNRPQV